MASSSQSTRPRSEIHYIQGDATDPQGDGLKIIAHICNDSGGWGRGFVLALSRRWAEPEAQYRGWHKHGFYLGEIDVVPVTSDIHVCNMIAQNGYGTKEAPVPVRYHALDRCLKTLGEHASSLDASVHMPRIGCGLGGGVWYQIQPMIEDYLCAYGVEVFVYDPA